MPKAHETWTVLRHHPIERIEENLWCVTGTLPGMDLSRVMTLVRREDGSVVVHSAIALDDESMSEIEAWGTPSVLLVPNTFHRLDAPAFAARYPEIKVLCPKRGRRKVEEVVRVDGTYEDYEGGKSLALEYLDGTGRAEGVLKISSAGGATLVFNDAVFNLPHGSGVTGFIFRYITGSTGGPRVTRLFRWFAVKDKAALRAHFERLADTPGLSRIIVSHGRPISDRPAEVLRKVAVAL
jgi:hypothetical protein